jgi:hypothetical protein
MPVAVVVAVTPMELPRFPVRQAARAVVAEVAVILPALLGLLTPAVVAAERLRQTGQRKPAAPAVPVLLF